MRKRVIAAVVLSSMVVSAIIIEAAQVHEVVLVAPSAIVVVLDMTINGRGFGYGCGLSQYGVQGVALAGKSVKQILDFYYLGMMAGKVIGSIWVWVSADTIDGVCVGVVSGLVVCLIAIAKVYALPRGATINQWSIDPNGEHGTKLFWFNAKIWKWTFYKTFTGMAQFEGALVIGFVLSSGVVCWYCGVLWAIDVFGMHLDTVNVLSLEYYLRGVVLWEAVSSWWLAVLQAQAVAARTYSVFHRSRATGKVYDLCDTTSYQIYNKYDFEKTSTNNAIAATTKQIQLYKGKPIIAKFSSSNGKTTTASDSPYQMTKINS